MKNQSDYFKKPHTELLEKTGAFYAFSNKQFDEKKQPDTKYIHCGNGLLVPKSNRDQLLKGLEDIAIKAVAQDCKENTVKQICWREFANHEIQFTGDLTPVYDALYLYPFNKTTINKHYEKYYSHCCKHSDRYF